METPLEHMLTHAFKEQVITFLKEHPEHFEEAINLALSDKQPYCWRVASAIWSTMEENDKRIQKHIKAIFNTIKTKKDGHQRELIKILMNMELNEDYEGILFNLCVDIWEKINKQPSVRYTALLFILKTAKKHPDLANEIVLFAQDHYLETLSPGIKRAIKNMVNEITK